MQNLAHLCAEPVRKSTRGDTTDNTILHARTFLCPESFEPSPLYSTPANALCNKIGAPHTTKHLIRAPIGKSGS